MIGGEVYAGTRQYKTDGKVSRGVKDGVTLTLWLLMLWLWLQKVTVAVCCLQFKTHLYMSKFGFFPPQNAFQSQPLQMPKEVEGLPFKFYFSGLPSCLKN